MSLWTKIETAPASAALFSWKMRFGDDLPNIQPWFLKRTNGRAQTVPCPRQCGCIHRVMPDNHATCDCGDCEDMPLTEADIEVWETNWTGLGNQVREAFDLEHKASPFPVAKVWQVGSFGGDALQIILVVQPDRTAFNEAIAQLVARLKTPFAVLTPTSVHHDIESRELLERKNAGLHDLESNVVLTPDGNLKALKTARELFANLLADHASRRNGDERPTARYVFRKAGSVCDVVFDWSPVFHVNNTDGAKYLDYLLHHPNKPIRAFDLEVTVKSDKGQARDQNSIQKTVDERARREAREELPELLKEFEDAKERGNTSKSKRLAEEITKIKAIIGDEGLLNADTGERARDNVRKAINKVVNKLRKGGKSEKAFGQHIAQFVSLGYDVAYNQSEGQTWG